MGSSELPIVVIGAGPIGLAAAAHLVDRGLLPLVLEAAERPAAHVLAWKHVRMFSPWKCDIDSAARELLLRSGWTEPQPEALPTGGELWAGYLRPLAKSRAAPQLGSR